MTERIDPLRLVSAPSCLFPLKCTTELSLRQVVLAPAPRHSRVSGNPRRFIRIMDPLSSRCKCNTMDKGCCDEEGIRTVECGGEG